MGQYDPNQVIVVVTSPVVGSQQIRSFADGQMINAEHDQDEADAHTGTDGDGRLVEMKSRKGTVTLPLADYSPSNDFLQQCRDAKVPFTITVADKTTKTALVFAEKCLVKKLPAFDRGKETTEPNWPFVTPKLKIRHSGAKD